MKEKIQLDDLSDVFNTIQDAVAALAAQIYADLIGTGNITSAEAGKRMRGLAKHMRSPEHYSHITGEGFARKLDSYALIIETSASTDT